MSNDIVPGAIPEPNGTYACQWIQAQKARAEQDDFVIYEYEWSYDGITLTPNGQKHVVRIAQQIQQSPWLIVIEPTADDQVNLARKAAVLDALAKSGVAIAADRVILGHPEAEGLYGQEALGITARMLRTGVRGQGLGGGALVGGGAFGGMQGNSGMSSGMGAGMRMGF
jgi:hypothetical protein